MERSFSRLRQGPFDLLVIGGGIYGAWTAFDATLRGLRVALVEARDWAAGTSSASSKLIHGGLRYLEHRHFDLVRKGLTERKRLWTIGRHRIRPLRFLVPVYEGDRVGRTRLKAGLWLYDHLAGPGQPGGPHVSLDRQALLAACPVLRSNGLKGGFAFGDCQTDDARLTLEVVDGALRAGAVAVNRARAAALLVEGARTVGAVVEDRETGESVEVRATVTMNCAGASLGSLAGEGKKKPAVRLTKGVHLVMPRLPLDDALLVDSPVDRRVVFLIPWYGRTLLGTTDTDYEGDPDDARVDHADIKYLLDRASRVLETPWRESEIVGSFAGVRVLPASRHRSPSTIKRDWKIERPLERLLVSVGGKLTSARCDAATAVDRVLEMLERPHHASATAERSLPWCPEPPYREWSRDALNRGLYLGLDEETAETCQLRYGSRIDGVYERIRQAPHLARRIVPAAPFCLAEIEHVVACEMARSLEDVVRRRIPLSVLCRLTEGTLKEIADIMGDALDWSEERRHDEVRTVLDKAGSPPFQFHETA